jgi:predicted nucleotidyltransferase
LDLVVEFSSMSPSEHARACFGLLEELENLFARRVDLVEISAVRNPYLRREIEEHHHLRPADRRDGLRLLCRIRDRRPR